MLCYTNGAEIGGLYGELIWSLYIYIYLAVDKLGVLIYFIHFRLLKVTYLKFFKKWTIMSFRVDNWI